MSTPAAYWRFPLSLLFRIPLAFACLAWGGPFFSGSAFAESVPEVDELLLALRFEGLSDELELRIGNFLEDEGETSEEDRLRVDMALMNARLKSQDKSDTGARLREAIALVERYPGQGGGYRYLLSVARKADDVQARSAIGLILAGSVPEDVTKGANRLLASLDAGGERPEAAVDLLAELRRGRVDKDLEVRVRQFLARRDEGASEADRLRVDLAMMNARLTERRLALPSERRRARMKDAKALVRKYPHQESGYKYLLSLAKAAEKPLAREVAELILSGAAPEGARKAAKRLLDNLNLEGGALDPSVLGLEVVPANGLVLYGWSSERPPPRLIDAQLAAALDVTFVGVNFDGDEALASELVAEWNLPGEQLVCSGLDGPLAERLCATTTRFVYLVNADGSFSDLSAQRDFSRKLASFASVELFEKGGAK